MQERASAGDGCEEKRSPGLVHSHLELQPRPGQEVRGGGWRREEGDEMGWRGGAIDIVPMGGGRSEREMDPRRRGEGEGGEGKEPSVLEVG